MSKAILLVISLLIALFVGTVVFYMSDIDFKYEKQKCVSLTSSVSSYDFTNRIETNANYNERCYYLNNHPLAYFNGVIFLSITLSILTGIFVFVMGILINPVINDSSYY